MGLIKPAREEHGNYSNIDIKYNLMTESLSYGEGNRVGHLLGTGYELWPGRHDTLSGQH